MMQKSIQALVLAAGKATRFNTGKTKLIEKICGQEMVLYITKILEELSIPTTVIVGYQASEVMNIINTHHTNINFIHQQEQCGTGNAVYCSKEKWFADNILIMNGDVPLITNDIIKSLLHKHDESHATITFITAHNIDPLLSGYGRVIQEESHLTIVESKEFMGDVQEHCCINAGIYLIKRSFLEQSIQSLTRNSTTGEIYLTDLIKIASNNDHHIEMHQVAFDRVRGINTLKELWTVEQIKRSEIISYWMEKGVRFYAAQAVHVDNNVTIGTGSYIGCGAHLINGSKVGAHCHIEPFSIINNSTLEDHVTIKSHSVITDSVLLSRVIAGPFAHIVESHINTETIIGNFVEIKKSTLGSKTKAKHLSFLGNATIGSQVNIGAGTITCNYNGVTKHQTIIEDNNFIGSNNTLVAPITIGKESYTAAGSTITHNVPADSLAIARSKQINKEHYAQKLKNKLSQQHPFIAAVKTNNNDSAISE